MATTTKETGARQPAREALPPGRGYAMKRVLLGPALPTSSLIHERLGKPTALAVFASDNLSSSAYATEEMLKVGIPAIGFAAFALVLPLTFALLGVLAILLFSYRQTIKAYPSAGGAYIVTKDNFGLLTAQLAGVALLTDYVLTVSVSVAAGVAAVTSAAGSLYPYRVWISVFCIWFIAWGNLRGVRESGRMFAIPTYYFIVMMFVLIGTGVVKAMMGGLHPLAPSAVPTDAIVGSGAAGLFLMLHMFASGGAAVTGVEAISNGVPAFKPPEWLNARTTLMWMGSLLGIMFLGVSFLASRLHAVPTETKTLNSQVARLVFGSGIRGTTLFLMLQIATTLILILAANTSFADFPRLANFHASDNFMPRQLTKRGHRLVFSNGIIGLAVASTALVVIFQADVHHLIPLYAIGVFTSFTLSQAGMAKRHLRLKEPGWKHGLAINGLGAVTTLLVTVILAITKFWHGAWAVMVFVPILVVLLVRMNHSYEREHRELEENLQHFSVETQSRPLTVLLVDEVDSKTVHALQYAKTIRADTLAVHIEGDALKTLELETAWTACGLDEVPMKILRGRGDEESRLAGFIGGLPAGRDITVLVPVPHETSILERLSSGRVGTRLTRALLPYERVRVTLVRDHPDGVHPLQHDDQGRPVVRLAPKGQHEVVILVDKLDAAVLRAVRYSMTLGANDVRAVHAALDPERAMTLADRWMEYALPIPLDVVECWDRNVGRTLEHYVLGLAKQGSEVTVVMPRRDFPKLRQRLLHDRTSRQIMRALGRYPHIDVAAVPFYFAPRPPAPSLVPTATSVE
jgi:amino acid transporter